MSKVTLTPPEIVIDAVEDEPTDRDTGTAKGHETFQNVELSAQSTDVSSDDTNNSCVNTNSELILKVPPDIIIQSADDGPKQSSDTTSSIGIDSKPSTNELQFPKITRVESSPNGSTKVRHRHQSKEDLKHLSEDVS